MTSPHRSRKATTDPLAESNVEQLFEDQRRRFEGRRTDYKTGEVHTNPDWALRIYGHFRSTRDLGWDIRFAAESDLHVLITGETGTGKELVAEEIARLAGKPMVRVNCAQFGSLIESELFGYVKGAFTGATATRKGLLEAAQGGILFLDEIGTLSETAQANLLRTIERGEVRRVGGTKVDNLKKPIRIIAATNNPDSIRPDLTWRFQEHIHVPPLRDRITDVFFFLQGFLEEQQKKGKIAPHAEWRFSSKTLARMLYSPWRGNVRELRNAAERAIARHLASKPEGNPFNVSHEHIPFSYCPAKDTSEMLYSMEATKSIYKSLAATISPVSGHDKYLSKHRLDAPCEFDYGQRKPEDEIYFLTDMSWGLMEDLGFSCIQAIQMVCLLATHHLQSLGLLKSADYSRADTAVASHLWHFDERKDEVLQLPADVAATYNADGSRKTAATDGTPDLTPFTKEGLLQEYFRQLNAKYPTQTGIAKAAQIKPDAARRALQKYSLIK